MLGKANELESFKAYLKRDCTSLSKVLDAFARKMIDYFGVSPSATLSLSSVKSFDKRFYPVKNIDSNEKFEQYVRAATYGGRNEIYQRYGEGLYLYDVRSMYTSCYDVAVPFGKLHWIVPDIDKGTIAEAKVKVPDGLIGILPYRINGRLIFPVGELQSWWDTRELRYAASLGVDVTIIRQLGAEESPLLKTFGDYVSMLRENEKESPIWKLFGVRLSGKFGQSRWRSEIKHVSEIEDFGGWYPLDKLEEYHERRTYIRGSKSPYIKPAINMRIRSEARIRHLQLLLDAKDIYYCDTDSVYTTSKLPVGEGPGDLRLLDIAARAYFVRCKFYGYATPTDKFIQRSSGFRDFALLEHDFQNLLKGKRLSHHMSYPAHWKAILSSRKVGLVERQRSVGSYVEFENRISSSLDTRPIKLPDDLDRLKRVVNG